MHANEGVRARVPIEGLAGGGIEGSELLTLHDLVAEGDRSLGLTEAEVRLRIAGEGVVRSRSFLELEVSTDVHGVVANRHPEDGVEVA